MLLDALEAIWTWLSIRDDIKKYGWWKGFFMPFLICMVAAVLIIGAAFYVYATFIDP